MRFFPVSELAFVPSFNSSPVNHFFWVQIQFKALKHVCVHTPAVRINVTLSLSSQIYAVVQLERGCDIYTW